MLQAVHREDSLAVALKAKIDAYKDKHPRKSSTQIAKEFQLTTTAFHRMENRLTRKPAFDQTIKILRGTGNQDDIRYFLEKYYPEFAETYDRVYQGNQEARFIPIEQENYFEDTQYYELMMLAYSNEGITRELIKENFGKRGLDNLEELLNKSILEEKNGRIKGASNNINASQETVKILLTNLITNNYKLKNFGSKTDANWLTLQFESVNKDKVMPKLSEILRETSSKIRSIINDPSNEGKDVIWTGLVMDALLSMDSSSEEILQ